MHEKLTSPRLLICTRKCIKVWGTAHNLFDQCTSTLFFKPISRAPRAPRSEQPVLRGHPPRLFALPGMQNNLFEGSPSHSDDTLAHIFAHPGRNRHKNQVFNTKSFPCILSAPPPPIKCMKKQTSPRLLICTRKCRKV